jgi:hypothetical protein
VAHIGGVQQNGVNYTVPRAYRCVPRGTLPPSTKRRTGHANAVTLPASPDRNLTCAQCAPLGGDGPRKLQRYSAISEV